MFNFQMVPLDDDYNSLFSKLYTLVSVSTDSDPQPKMRATKYGSALVVFVPNSRGRRTSALPFKFHRTSRSIFRFCGVEARDSSDR